MPSTALTGAAIGGPLATPKRYDPAMPLDAPDALTDHRQHCRCQRRPPRVLSGGLACGTEDDRPGARVARKAPLGPR